MAYDYRGPASALAQALTEDDGQECFTVGLRLRDGDTVTLFRYRGCPGRGHEAASRSYCEQLRKQIGVPLN